MNSLRKVWITVWRKRNSVLSDLLNIFEYLFTRPLEKQLQMRMSEQVVDIISGLKVSPTEASKLTEVS